jgi:hypothetical protein
MTGRATSRAAPVVDEGLTQIAVTLSPCAFSVRPHEHGAAANRQENVMIEANQIKYLRVALLEVGLIFVVGIYPLTIVWPSGWAWHTGQSEYLQMILGIYVTLGVFLIVASRNPLAHRSLIWFTVWSSVVHGGIMAIQSLVYPQHIGHLWGDVLALFAVAAALAFLTLRSSREAGQPHSA